MSEGFTNRHGKRTSVDGAVDEITATETVITKPAVVPAQKPKSTRRLKLKRPSKKVLLILGIAIILIICGYIVAADTARRDFDRVASATASKVTNVKAQSISEETSAIDTVTGLRQKLNTNEPCQSNMPNFIYTVYPPAQQSLQRCNQASDAYTALLTSLATMDVSIHYLDAQSKAVNQALSSPADGAYAEIPNYVTASQKALVDLKAIQEVPSDLANAHAELVTSMEALSAAWTELGSANSAQNQEAFTAAEKKLATAYEAIRTSGDKFDANINSLQSAISIALGKF